MNDATPETISLDDYLQHKRRQRNAVFQDAASSSILMVGVNFPARHAYYPFDLYCWLFMIVRTGGRDKSMGDMEKYYADARDTYHALWVVISLLAYTAGWYLTDLEGETWTDWLLWIVPLAVCVYRVFHIGTALIEIYFRESEDPHHQFRILLHTFLYYLAVCFSFALFDVFTDWAWNSYSTVASDGEVTYQFNEWFDAIYHSMLTVMAFSPNNDPQNWIGKLLVLIEICIGFALATFIFLNIMQLWTGKRE